MSDMSLAPKAIPLLAIPPASHIAVYRNILGQVTSQRSLYLPKASDADALEVAKGWQGTSDVYCDVFEIIETRCLGGWVFRKDEQL